MSLCVAHVRFVSLQPPPTPPPAPKQVTKLLRAGAALACAPLIDRGLDRLGLRDKKRKAYLLIVLGCVLLASAVMCALIASHA